jgi:hypothetical protein
LQFSRSSAAEIGRRRVVALEHGPHGAIEDQDAGGHRVFKLFPAC